MLGTKGLRSEPLAPCGRVLHPGVKSTDQKFEAQLRLRCDAGAAASQLHAHRTAHRRPCASATRAGITMGMPPHTKCCGCCCNLHVGTMIGTGLYVALLFILTVILPAIFGQEGADQAKAFCKGTTPAYRQGPNDINSALPPCTRRPTHPAPAPASLPGAQATTCVTAPISATTTGTRWSRPRPRLACTAGPSASFCSCC